MSAQRILAGLAALLLCAAAHAFTSEDLQDRAAALKADYVTLEDQIAGCPDGTCDEADALATQLGSLSDRLGQLHADRDALGPCSCDELDALLGADDDLDSKLHVIVDNWESTS